MLFSPNTNLKHEGMIMPRTSAKSKKQCGLCGAIKDLARTDCCGQWICDDESQYKLFSYAHNSCSRNHRRYTLCGNHDAERHEGKWQECAPCREGIDTEMYVYYGTNAYNFEKLSNPPTFEPARCAKCKKIIGLGKNPYSVTRDGYYCKRCAGELIKSMS